MIPKKIHYCWFGKGKIPNKELKCINSWRRLLPDFEIIRWDETNFDVNSVVFTKEAYQAKKYAFVADYVRIHALKNEGGIYLDTDVEVIRPFNDLLQCNFLSGFEIDGVIQTGVIGSAAGSDMINKIFEYYKGRVFLKENGEYDQKPNSAIIADLMKEMNISLENKKHSFNGIMLYPSEYFCPINQATWEIVPTSNTYCIHYLSGSWLPFRDRCNRKLKSFIGKYFGFTLVEYLRSIFK